MTHSLRRVPFFSILICSSLLLVTLSTTISAFVVAPPRSAHTTRWLAATAPTLTEATTWNVRLVMRGLISAQGSKLDPLLYTIETQFVEDQGYEPPQGTLKMLSNTKNSTTTTTIPIVKSRWILSEDPNDRKDGLWVWGLFKEPLYPFLLLTLQTDDIPLPNNNGTDFVPAMQLYAQINHRREEGKVILEGKDLCWRRMETVRADPLGAATVDLYDNVVVGTIALQPKQS
ncbi:hypothetical protein FisN_24Lh038 [Fistulifera solaris]|uniref:Uncharacterized protein n=1 Tax=Fistulifera solaris TaxID=1519565 RepID=A0A1Z5KU60_FISSO|nr:hypothetical protein FisN_24Lh038 [Fistulifera solaris]|eukprot:GAX29581.1 hypothetical protein FisN_24Lh038 [Fistulifera solaris]